MFEWFRSRRKNGNGAHPPPSEPATAMPETDDPSPIDAPTAFDFQLGRWLALSKVQKRTLEILCSELEATTRVVEESTLDLNTRFQSLAQGARTQTERVQSIVSVASEIEFEGRKIPLNEVARFLNETLSAALDKILGVTEEAKAMVHGLDGVIKSVDRIGGFIADIEKINKQTNLLALNATIEAARAGEKGRTFAVVAGGVRELSSATTRLAEDMREEIGAVLDGIRDGHAALKKVGTSDLSDNVEAKDRLDAMMASLVRQNAEFGAVLEEAAAVSNKMSNDISSMITGMQFQDRTKQRVEHVVDSLKFIGRITDELQAETEAHVPEEVCDANLHTEWLREMLSRYKLGDVRDDFMGKLLSHGDVRPEDLGGASVSTDREKGGSDIELF